MLTRILLLFATFTVGLLRAGIVTYTVTPNPSQFLYQFTLTNTGETGGTLYDLFLSLPTDISNIDTTTIGTPVGWGDATGGLVFFGPDVAPSTSFIEWASDFSGLYDAGIGDSLAGFSFSSVVDVGQPITFALNGSTDFAAAQGVSSVPEPATTLLLVPVLVAIAFRTRFRSAAATEV
jgi:hypothetical protein